MFRPIAFLACFVLLTALGACGKPAPVAPASLSAIKAVPSEAVSGKVMTAGKKGEGLKIKLKRDKNGAYAWEIDGGRVYDILKADRLLERRLPVRKSDTGKTAE